MNRPFYAFGVLLVLLALAMAAVSSSSRSTTVQTPQEGGSLLTPTPSRGTNFVVVLPAGDEPAEGSLQAGSSCDLAAPAIKPASVCLLEFDAGGRSLAVADCLSHYDRAYDELIYGQADAPSAAAGSTARPGLDAEDILAVFHSLAGSPPPVGRPLTPLPAPYPLTTLPASRLTDRAILLGVRNWLLRPLERWTEDTRPGPAVDWNEYAQLMRSLDPPQPAIIAEAKAPALASETVRSGGWLLHFAVSSLSRLGLTLQQAAEDLEHLEGPRSGYSSGTGAEATSE